MARHAWTHQTKTSTFTCYLSLDDISMQKIKETDGLILKILMIRESCNLTGWVHFKLYINCKPLEFPLVWGFNEKRENYNVVSFKLLPPKTNDTILWKLTQKCSWKSCFLYLVSESLLLSRILEKKEQILRKVGYRYNILKDEHVEGQV